MKSYELNYEEEIKFCDLVDKKQNLIKLSLYKVHISPNNYNDFYSFALEGLLQAFLISEKEGVSGDDFDKIAFSIMKRKVIDELRRRNREKFICVEDYEHIIKFKDNNNDIEEVDFYNSIEQVLNDEEKSFFKIYRKYKNINIVMKKMGVSKSTAYAILKNIKIKCERLVYKGI